MTTEQNALGIRLTIREAEKKTRELAAIEYTKTGNVNDELLKAADELQKIAKGMQRQEKH